MKRREFLVAGATATLLTSTNIGATAPASIFVDANHFSPHAFSSRADKLTPPAEGSIPVAFAISMGATMIDFAGPWEVFQDVMLKGPTGHRSGFNLYTVSEKIEPIEVSAGMKIVPDYTFERAPAPKVVVIPAQSGSKTLHA